jgi:hypothetical protein
VHIADSALGERAGKRGLGEARPAGGCNRPDVDQQPDSGLDELAEELVDGLALIADREEPAAQSNSSSRKLFLRLP